MGPAQRIRQVGFRKWYERELLHSHGNLLLLLFATLGLLGSLEVYSTRQTLLQGIPMLAGACACAAIGYYALRRYLRALAQAEFVARQAICPACTAYAKWGLVDGPPSESRLRVRCRACSHRWEIEL